MFKRTITFILILTAAFSVAALFFFFTEDKGVSDQQYREAFRRNYKIFAPPSPEKIDFAGENVPVEVFYISEALDRELLINTYWHNKTVLLFKRAHRWFPVIEPILEKNGIPEDFKYLAVIESDLSNAVSPSGAAGFWQFLKGTAKDYKLEVTKEVDERYHVEKSTEAACRYLKDSYERFGSWALVAAAYNGGNRRIREALDEQGVDSYYDLLLSEETSRYVFRILALKTIFEHPTKFGFFLREKDFYPPVPVRKIIVKERIDDLAAFAREQGINYKVLKLFNPWLRSNSLKPKKGKEYIISIPEETYRDYDKLLEDLKDDTIVFGDTIRFNEL
jgi:hypothetical protein